MASINFRGHEIHYASREDFWKLVEAEGWEKETFDAIDRFVKPNTTFVDIGAWNGVFSIYAKLKGANVFSVEPDPEAYKELHFNLFENKININVDFCSVGLRSSTSFLIPKDNKFGTSESRIEPISNGNHHLTHCYRLDYLIDLYNVEDISLIKADIEGSEVDMFLGAKDWITELRPTMHISLHPAYIGQEGIDKIAEIIFPIYDVTSDKGTPCTPENFNEVIESHQHAFILQKKEPQLYLRDLTDEEQASVKEKTGFSISKTVDIR